MAEKFLNLAGLERVVEKIKARLALKQDLLISGTNIKTIDGQSLVGSGNLDLSYKAELSVLNGTDKFIDTIQNGSGKTEISSNYTPDIVEIKSYEGENVISVQVPTKNYVDDAAKEKYSVGNEILVGTWEENGVSYPVYRKVFDYGQLPNAGSVGKPHGISNIYSVTRASGIAAGNGTFFPIPFATTDPGKTIYLAVGRSSVTISTGNTDRSAFTAKVIIEFTRQA